MNTAIDTARVRTAIEQEKVLTLITYRYLGHERTYIDQVLELYLREVGRPELQNKLSYCIHELAGNAKKANTKRAYFNEKGLDIHNPVEYHLGMQNFKLQTLPNIDHYVALQEEMDLHIKFQFKREGNTVKLAVRNNAEMTAEEHQRVKNKIDLARQAQSLPEIMELSEDYSEGAGLGIVMSIMMLRNLGVSEENFQIFCRNGATYAVLYLDIPEQKLRKTGY